MVLTQHLACIHIERLFVVLHFLVTASLLQISTFWGDQNEHGQPHQQKYPLREIMSGDMESLHDLSARAKTTSIFSDIPPSSLPALGNITKSQLETRDVLIDLHRNCFKV